jgi:RNA polymerase sigma-70 factor (ECF subfamily)
MVPSFEEAVTELFRQRFHTLFRYLDRLTGDPDVAQDLAQEAFVRLYQRGEMPDDPAAWLTTVATNLFRDTRRTDQRRSALVTEYAADAGPSDDGVSVHEGIATEEIRACVRDVLDTLPLRDRQLLLLRHEGYSYRELAHAVGIAENSVGTLLLRASRAFQTAFTKRTNASNPTLD